MLWMSGPPSQQVACQWLRVPTMQLISLTIVIYGLATSPSANTNQQGFSRLTVQFFAFNALSSQSAHVPSWPRRRRVFLLLKISSL